MHHVGFVLIVIVLLVIAAYGVMQYGVPHNYGLPGFNASSTVNQGSNAKIPAKQNSGATIQSQQRDIASPQSSTSNPVANYYGALDIKPSDIPAGFSIRDISPYFGKIRLSASPGSSGSYSQISLTSSLPSSGGPLNITGWLLRGNRGSQYIPQAVSVYDPSGLAPQSDIYFKNGDTLKIYSTSSGIGVNIRMNKCIGYLANSNKFNPSLSFDCPRVNRSEIVNFTSQCQNYILSLNSCQMPASNPPIPFNDYSCASYLNNLNYGGCFSKHRNDYDFFSNQWVAWSSSHFLDFQHDRLLLFDKQGLLVAEYNY